MLTEKQRLRKVNDRREFLINELFRLNEHKYINLPIYSYSLAELEQIHINEKCRSEHVFAYLHGVAR